MLDASAFDGAVDEAGAPSCSRPGARTTPTLVVATEDEAPLIKSFRNLERVLVTVPAELEVAAVVWARSLLVTEAALPLVEGRRSAVRAAEGRAGAVPEREVALMASTRTRSCSRRSCRRRATPASADRKYTFKVHPDAHKTQIRQAVEELFDVKVERVNIVKVQAEAEAPRADQGPAAGLEEGDRAAARGRDDRDLRGGSGLMALAEVQADEPRPPLHDRLRLRRGHEDGAGEER